jgi:hypothetical protein
MTAAIGTAESAIGTSWEELTQAGETARSNMDDWRWFLGDLAGVVTGVHGENALGKYATGISINYKTLQGYERVSSFYTKKPARGALNLSWSHYRLAMELGKQSAAFRFLRECSDGSLSVAESVRLLRKKQKRPVPPRKLFEGSLDVEGFPEQWKTVLAGIGWDDLGKYEGKRIRAIFYEESA